jgi:hypothetical protein
MAKLSVPPPDPAPEPLLEPPAAAPEERQWVEAHPGNLDGDARALTVLGPMRPRDLWKLRLAFLLRRYVAVFREAKARPLRALSFIHFARWTLIEGLPGADGVTRKPLPETQLYFESNFNGPFEAYIDAFSYVITPAMQTIFGGAYGFPGAKPATEFKRYIRRHDLEAAHFYCAYCEHTVTEIVASLQTRARLLGLVHDARVLSAEAFATAWRDLLAGRPELVPVKLGHPKDPNYAMAGQAYALTVITAITPGRRQQVRDALARLGRPFAQSPATHFARLVVVDRLPVETPPGAVPLDFPYLLFSAVLDGDPDAYLKGLCAQMPDEVDAIWGAGVGAPTRPSANPEAFTAWMRINQHETNAFFAPYGAATVAEVCAALGLGRRVRAFATRTADHTPSTLQAEFRREFEDVHA